MSEQRALYHTDPSGEPGRRKPGRSKLRIVKPGDPAASADNGLTNYDATAENASREASAILGNAVMHAAMSWVACCMEKQGESVEVMPLGGGLFDAEVHLEGGETFWLRVRLILEAGPVLSTWVEPIHP